MFEVGELEFERAVLMFDVLGGHKGDAVITWVVFVNWRGFHVGVGG